MEQRIVILGAGESGTGAAVLARKQGFDVFVSDSERIKDHYKEILFNYEIEWEEGKHTERLILNADEVIKSPGISEKSDIVMAIRKKGITDYFGNRICRTIYPGQEDLHHRQQWKNHYHHFNPSYAAKSRAECRIGGAMSAKVLPCRWQLKIMITM